MSDTCKMPNHGTPQATAAVPEKHEYTSVCPRGPGAGSRLVLDRILRVKSVLVPLRRSCARAAEPGGPVRAAESR